MCRFWISQRKRQPKEGTLVKFAKTGLIELTIAWIWDLCKVNDKTKQDHNNTDLFSQETVAFLFHIVVYDPGHFLLPDFQTVDVYVILNVLKRPTESIHSSTQLFQLYIKFRLLLEINHSVVENPFGFEAHSYFQSHSYLKTSQGELYYTVLYCIAPHCTVLHYRLVLITQNRNDGQKIIPIDLHQINQSGNQN